MNRPGELSQISQGLHFPRDCEAPWDALAEPMEWTFRRFQHLQAWALEGRRRAKRCEDPLHERRRVVGRGGVFGCGRRSSEARRRRRPVRALAIASESHEVHGVFPTLSILLRVSTGLGWSWWTCGHPASSLPGTSQAYRGEISQTPCIAVNRWPHHRCDEHPALRRRGTRDRGHRLQAPGPLRGSRRLARQRERGRSLTW